MDCFLDHDEKKSLAIFLCYNLATHFQLKDTQGAKVAAAMVGKCDRTVWQWRSDMVSNNGPRANRVGTKEVGYRGTMKSLVSLLSMFVIMLL